MEMSAIANLAARIDTAQPNQEVGITVLKKALDVQATNAAALLRALPPVQQPANLPRHLGQNVNTTA
jgi:hypothetical protein